MVYSIPKIPHIYKFLFMKRSAIYQKRRFSIFAALKGYPGRLRLFAQLDALIFPAFAVECHLAANTLHDLRA